jgi:hypothetical protein
MPAIITKNYRVLNADTFVRSLADPALNYLYLFIGKSLAWPGDTPPEALDNQDSTDSIWNNILSLKRILTSDVTLGIQKRPWVYNTYYSIYRHDYGSSSVTGVSSTGAITTPTELCDTNYYVVTENGNVYICIDNNRNGVSTENPQYYGTGIGFDVFTTADNYRWKFICTVSPTDYAKFSTLEFHPVKTIMIEPNPGDSYESQYLQQVDAATKGGAVLHVVVKAEEAGTSAFTSTTITGTTNNASSPIKVYGDGSGLSLKAYTNSSGGVTKFEVLTYGAGYSYCSISIPGVTGGVFTPIITPRIGLGADPVKDLCAFYVLIDIRLSYAEGDGDFTVGNEYRQVGIISNPKNYGGGSLAVAGTLDASTSITLTAPGPFVQDDEIVNNVNGTIARVIDWDDGAHILRLNYPRPTDATDWNVNAGFASDDTISLTAGGAAYTIAASSVKDPGSGVVPSEVEPFSGDVIYYENRRAIGRDISQVEDIHISIEF